MSEPRKDENQPKHFPTNKQFLLIIFGIAVIGVVVIVLIYVSDQPEVESAQQSPPNVIPEITNAMNPDKFDINNFDKCVMLLIDYVKSVEIFDSTQSSTNKMKVNDIMAQYDSLNCPLVESQLSQTDQYKNRDNLEQ